MISNPEGGRTTSTPRWSAVVELAHRAVTGLRGKVLVGTTVLLGLAGAVAVSVGTPPSSRTFALTSMAVQLLMSVTVPFFDVLLTAHRSTAGRGALAPRLLAAVALAAAFAVFGVAVSAVALVVAPSSAPGGGWQNAGAVAVGSVVVQVVAQLTGTGLGLLLRPPGAAMLATVVLPLGLWLVLGAVAALQPAQAWLTPFPVAGQLLSGQLRASGWAQALVVLLIWGGGLNALGAWRVRRLR